MQRPKQKFNDLHAKGYRVADIESYRQGPQQKYAAIWVNNTNKRGWTTRRDINATWAIG